MVLISGVLKGPYGDSRSGVTITMRSMKTSSTVLNLAKSQSVTDDTGRYSLNVEPGAYEVIVSVYGAQPERVGTIEVYTDSLPGTLNDFLRRPGESDITPEIVQTVDRLRADAALSADKSAASAAAAKISENNAAGTLASAIKNGGYGQIVPPRINGPIGARRYCKIAECPISSTGATAVHFAVIGGRNYGVIGMDIKYVYFTGRGSTITSLHARGLEILSLGLTPNSVSDIEFGALYNNTISRWELWVCGPAFNVPNITLLSSIRESPMLDVVPMGDYKWQAEQPLGYKAYAIKNTWSDYNATVDGNGFLKAASPIARLASSPESMQDDYLSGGFSLSGCAAVNGEAEGVSAERVSVGVYKVTGALGFAEDGWNIEVPQDVNGNRLCFVSANTGKDGTIYVKVSKRRFDIDTAAIVAGEPMDIPAGRWIDLRLEMPAREVEAAPEAVEETAALENVNVDPI
ncbi:prophage tail fiber N-terminal domain-containing protein [Serratia sp. JKS000199]|uniref:phage tail fiber protein n=1 Tax=Serratia sp. JKS000199 TaxID=1938820 RepID=UPI000BC013DD|nr:prophage tail fiber N-terminal domain-containing protein [Serratia sp. JKS000199]SNY85060.1 Prophage tail fibre N-terminal domain-containing protein [Serratia sp. JKS000199]